MWRVMLVVISEARLAYGPWSGANGGKSHPQRLQQKHGAVVAVPAQLH